MALTSSASPHLYLVLAVQVRAERSGNQTAIADILRLVETAQARTAPVQRLADAVAGKFAYAVMGVSAATFAFWATVGTRLFPQVPHHHFQIQ